MKGIFISLSNCFILWLFLAVNETAGQGLDDFKFAGSFRPEENSVRSDFQFNGYTNYWHDIYRKWIRYGNLFKMAAPNMEYTIAQSRTDIADDMHLPGLSIQEGFLNGLIAEPYIFLDQPETQKLAEEMGKGNVLVMINPDTDMGKRLMEKLPPDVWKARLKSHQSGAADFTEVNAWYLENGTKKLFIISSKSRALQGRLAEIIDNAKNLINKYDLKRGWFGAETLLKSVTCTAGHPLEVIGKGMNEGNSWFTFSGYMDFLAGKEIENWLEKIDLPVVTGVGYGNIFGCEDYNGLQVQHMFTPESWIRFAHEKNGYIFRQVYDPEADPYHYDGYIAGEGNKEQIDNENVPFVTTTGSLDEGAVPGMVLFVNKGGKFTNKEMWEAIMDRREVGVLGNGKMMGPALYRNALELLLLDRVFLEEYFGDRVNLEAYTENYRLNVSVANTYSHAISGTIEIVLPPELNMPGETSFQVNLPAGSSKTMVFQLKPLAAAMNNTNPIALHYKWGTGSKSTITMLDLPPAVSVHQLLYGHTPALTYPVTIHNFTDQAQFPVMVEVMDKKSPEKPVFKISKICNAESGTFSDMVFDLNIPASGDYQVKVSALGLETQSQLGMGEASGTPRLTEADLDGDGIMEYRMENDSVLVTLLTTGARVIEYIVKSRNDNVLYKSWPVRPVDDKRPFRKRGYYPYGGFEEFLGQASMETHKVYTGEVIQKEGDYVRVRMTADYFGNRLEKIFTLYGNSPLLEIRFALTFRNPEANLLGPVPILEIGERHWTEDVFTVPEMDGLHEYRMMPERYFGKIIFPKEGWDAGYDTRQDITFVGAYPVKQPLFLHMFMNHPVNPDAHFYCNEFQPWTPIFQKSTMYFTYYLWGAPGRWQNGVKALRDRNLITIQQ